MSSIDLDFDFQTLLGKKLHVSCASWGENAEKLFSGIALCDITPATITRVYKGKKGGRPLFECYFEEIEQTFNRLDLDYVIEFCCDLPEWFSQRKKEILERKARVKSKRARTVMLRSNSGEVQQCATPTKLPKISKTINNPNPVERPNLNAIPLLGGIGDVVELTQEERIEAEELFKAKFKQPVAGKANRKRSMPNRTLKKVGLRKATETKKTKAENEKYTMKTYWMVFIQQQKGLH